MKTNKHYYALAMSALLLTMCGTREARVNKLQQALVGEWRNTYLKVTMPSAGGKEDSTSVMEADSANWAEVLHMKPIQTFFDADSTWHSDHYAPNDSLLFIARGTWYMTGDTLVMEVLEPTRAVYRLHTAIKGDAVKFHSVLDFDEDGVADDDYVGWQRKHQH